MLAGQDLLKEHENELVDLRAVGEELVVAHVRTRAVAKNRDSIVSEYVMVFRVRRGRILWGCDFIDGAPPPIGPMRAKRYLLTGDSLSADEAYDMGLVSEVVESGQSLARATELAEKVAELSPKAVQATKRALNEWLRTAFGPVFKHGLALEFLSFPVAESSYGSGEIPPERSV